MLSRTTLTQEDKQRQSFATMRTSEVTIKFKEEEG